MATCCGDAFGKFPAVWIGSAPPDISSTFQGREAVPCIFRRIAKAEGTNQENSVQWEVWKFWSLLADLD